MVMYLSPLLGALFLFTPGWAKVPEVDLDMFNAVLQNFDRGGVVVYFLKKYREGNFPSVI